MGVMHHAYLHLSSQSLPDFSHVDTADLVEISEPKLSIDTVRNVITQAYTKPLTQNGSRVIVVTTDHINTEAQNALLKVLEEPPVHTRFHFVVSDHSRLLPTLLSRFAVSLTTAVKDTAVAEAFVKLSFKDRLEHIAEKTTAKDIMWQKELLYGLECLCSKNQLSTAVAHEVLFAKQHLQGPGASAKMLLEHVALIVPVPGQ